jgi:hypothetical protein
VHEETRRREVFEHNLRFVQGHDAEATGFNVNINAYGDLTAEEFARAVCSSYEPLTSYFIDGLDFLCERTGRTCPTRSPQQTKTQLTRCFVADRAQAARHAALRGPTHRDKPKCAASFQGLARVGLHRAGAEPG